MCFGNTEDDVCPFEHTCIERATAWGCLSFRPGAEAVALDIWPAEVPLTSAWDCDASAYSFKRL